MLRNLQARVERLEADQKPQNWTRFLFVEPGETVDEAKLRHRRETGQTCIDPALVIVQWKAEAA